MTHYYYLFHVPPIRIKLSFSFLIPDEVLLVHHQAFVDAKNLLEGDHIAVMGNLSDLKSDLVKWSPFSKGKKKPIGRGRRVWMTGSFQPMRGALAPSERARIGTTPNI